MNILLAGGSGFLGQKLAVFLQQLGFQVYFLHRNRPKQPTDNSFFWAPESGVLDAINDLEFDAVINLCGANIGAARWSDKRKQLLIDSRVKPTRTLAKAILDKRLRTKRLINASAIGIYGATRSEVLNEDSEIGDDFMAKLVQKWEKSADLAQTSTNVIKLRFGVVLHPDGGMLQKLKVPFSMGLGGKIGSGSQALSWVSLHDLQRLIGSILTAEVGEYQGAYNVVAPEVVSNAEFTKHYAKSLSRPAIFPMPAFVAKTLFGEMGEALLLGGVTVKSQRLLDAGFTFEHASLAQALELA